MTVLDKTEIRPTELILADAKRLKQVLLILLKNAVKYSNSDSEISIQNQLLTNGNMQFTVKDFGKGIPEQEQSMIFQPCNRLDDNTDVQEGVGIGLFILKHLINTMGVQWVFIVRKMKVRLFG